MFDQDNFQPGYTLFVFHLNPDEEVEVLSPISNGNLRLEMRFHVMLPHTITLVVYAVYDSILEIHSKRHLVDYY